MFILLTVSGGGSCVLVLNFSSIQRSIFTFFRFCRTATFEQRPTISVFELETLNSKLVSDFLSRRPRRNRKSAAIRAMVEETRVSTDDLIFPIFLLEGNNKRVEVASMPGIFRLSADLMLKEVEECMKLGIRAFDIFPVVDEQHKDKKATKSYDKDFFYLRALREIKKQF